MHHGLAVLPVARCRRPVLLCSVALLAAAGAARAHVTLETPQALAGSYYKAVLRVGHGCTGSPVTQFVVDIPDGVKAAKPMAKPGWRIDIVRAKLARPYESHGRSITEEVAQIRFSGGSLPDAHYDEFALQAQLPDQPGPLYWKVSQVCEQGRIDWTEVPKAGEKLFDLKAPAALLEVVPAEHAGHQH